MIDYYSVRKGGLVKLKDYSKKCWINVINPSEEEITFLEDKFNLNKDNLVDGLDIHENSRFEIEDKRIYIFLTAPTEKISSEYDSSFLIIYSKDFFITYSKYNLEIIEKLIESERKSEESSFSRQLLKILFMISRTFEISVRKTMRGIKKNKKQLNKLTDKDIVKLIQEEDKLNGYISSFGSIIQTYNKILRDKTISFFKKEAGETIEDLIIDLNETLTLCKDTLKTISNMRDYYSTKLSNDLNQKVTILTLFTIFLTIPTLISGIYGMNINLPIQGNPNVLFILGGAVVLIWGILFLVLKKFKIV